MENKANEIETRSVLAGAYKGSRVSLVSTLTHLAINGLGHCNKKLNLADSFALNEIERAARPTCPKCAAKWDKIQKKSDSALAAKVRELAPAGAAEETIKALTAAVENQMLTRMWDKMHGPIGELTEFGHAVVSRVARDVWTEIHKPKLEIVR